MRIVVAVFLGLCTLSCLLFSGYLAYNDKNHFLFMIFALVFGSGTAATLDKKD